MSQEDESIKAAWTVIKGLLEVEAIKIARGTEDATAAGHQMKGALFLIDSLDSRLGPSNIEAPARPSVGRLRK